MLKSSLFVIRFIILNLISSQLQSLATKAEESKKEDGKSDNLKATAFLFFSQTTPNVKHPIEI